MNMFYVAGLMDTTCSARCSFMHSHVFCSWFVLVPSSVASKMVPLNQESVDIAGPSFAGTYGESHVTL